MVVAIGLPQQHGKPGEPATRLAFGAGSFPMDEPGAPAAWPDSNEPTYASSPYMPHALIVDDDPVSRESLA